MENTHNCQKGLTGNQLKILALISMTCDHIGKQLLPNVLFLQIIGRLAFPIFAFMIAEGCHYTKNRKKYLGTMALLAFICQIVYFAAMGSLYQCVLVTFSLSISLIYILDTFVFRKPEQFSLPWAFCTFLGLTAALLFLCFICIGLPELLSATDFAIDYGIWGVLLPVVIYFTAHKTNLPAGFTLLATAMDLIFLSFSLGGIQWFSLITIGILAFYNKKRGSLNLKNLFYIYYPLHLVVIYGLSLFS